MRGVVLIDLPSKFPTLNAMKPCIIIHYDEIGLKGNNRGFFEQKLIDNVSQKIENAGLKAQVRKNFGRMKIGLENFPNENEKNVWKTILDTTFGIAYYGFGFQALTEGEDESLKDTIKFLAENTEFETFRITTNRTNKNFPMTSMEVNHMLGGTVLKNFEGKKVQLKNPDVEFYVEILGKHAFCYAGKQQGPGGLPIGSAGKGLVLISGGIDSPVAAYFMQKRGMNVQFIHFHSYPQTSQKSVDKVRQLTQKLTKFHPNLNLHMCPFLEIQKEVLKNIPDKYRIIMYRRIMLKIAERLAKKIGAKALITGESLSQVASQTIENMTVIHEAVDLIPVLQPLIGFDKSEIINVAKKIDTFQTSIKPHDDCCTVFMPKSPETKGKLDKVLEAEEKIDIEALVEMGFNEIELEKITL